MVQNRPNFHQSSGIMLQPPLLKKDNNPVTKVCTEIKKRTKEKYLKQADNDEILHSDVDEDEPPLTSAHINHQQ